jgi:hypothetical protein
MSHRILVSSASVLALTTSHTEVSGRKAIARNHFVSILLFLLLKTTICHLGDDLRRDHYAAQDVVLLNVFEAQDQFWQPQRGRKTRRRTPAHRVPHLSAATDQRARVSNRCDSLPLPPSSRCVITAETAKTLLYAFNVLKT